MKSIRIHENWPLWVAGIASAFSIAALFVFAVVWPTDNKTGLGVPWSSQPIDYWSIVPSPISVSVRHIIFFGWIGSLITLLVMIGWMIYAQDSRGRKLFVAGILIVSNAGACLSCTTLIFQTGYETIFQHIDSANFHEHIYHLTHISSGQKWDIHAHYLVIFQCEASGNACNLLHNVNVPYWSDGSEYHFTVDTTANVLFIETEFELYPVAIPE